MQEDKSQYRAHDTIWANLCAELETIRNVVLREADGCDLQDRQQRVAVAGHVTV